MKKQVKTSMRTIVRYIRDFSIVVAGIAVTLYVNDRVTNQGEKRDVKRYLNAIIFEMEENIKYLDEKADNFQNSVNYANYLRSHKKSKLVSDSINKYSDAIFSIITLSFKTTAFEMFKSSGTMRLIDNKELLLSIWETYSTLEKTKSGYDIVNQVKMDEINKTFLLKEEEKKDVIPMYKFHYYGYAEQMQVICISASQELKEVLPAIVTYYNNN